MKNKLGNETGTKMKKIDRLLQSIETKSTIMEQDAVTLDHDYTDWWVRPTYADGPEHPYYAVVGKEFHPEIESGVLYNVAYYQLQGYDGTMHHKLVAAYEIVLAYPKQREG